MANNRIRRTNKKAPRKAAPKAKAPAGKEDLTLAQMLKRIPKKETMTTAEVQFVFNDCHVQTVYKMNGSGELKPYRKRARGRASFYLTADIIAAVKKRFQLIPTSSDTTK